MLAFYDATGVGRGHDASVVAATTYAVVWEDGDVPPRAGKLSLGLTGIRLDGPSSLRVGYEEIEHVRIARRFCGRRALVLSRRRSRPLRITSVRGAGELTELAELVRLRAG